MYSLRTVLTSSRDLKGSAIVSCAAVLVAFFLFSIGCAQQSARENRKVEGAVDKARQGKESQDEGPHREDPEILLSTVAWSPDGKFLASGYTAKLNGRQRYPEEGRVAKIWDVKTGKRLHVLKGHDGAISFVGFLPDSTRVVTAGGSTVKMWDVREGKQLWSANAHACRRHLMRCHPTANMCFLGDMRTAKPSIR